MPITYKNRKGRTYYLCRDLTKSGKPRYYFSRAPKGKLLKEIPEGYEIRESVNAVVSLVKIRPMQISEQETVLVFSALSKHPKEKNYRVDVKSKQITIYEHIGPSVEELAASTVEIFGIKLDKNKELIQWMEKEESSKAQFTSVMRFILADSKKRHFNAQRMCYIGSIDDWIYIDRIRPLKELVKRLIPALGTDKLYELV
ncbi:MAG TPA: hypothetical protein ENN79_14335 [Desulfobacteraceae bacterium]|nr:hypothetical protein [Desulfobacteraceae bacterium]